MPVLIGSVVIAVAILLSGRRVAASIPQSEPVVSPGPSDLFHCGLSCGDVAPGALSDGGMTVLSAPILPAPTAAPKPSPKPVPVPIRKKVVARAAAPVGFKFGMRPGG